MTTKDFKNNLIEAIRNNSNLECDEEDTILFTGIDRIRATREFEPKILVEAGDKMFINFLARIRRPL